MSELVMTSKRAARIERRKSRAAAFTDLPDKPKVVEGKEEETVEPSQKRVKLSDEEYHSIKILLRERKRAILNAPLFRLIQVGLNASLNLPRESRVPVLASDVQTLLLFPVIGDSGCFQFYKWCSLARWNNLSQTLVMIVDNVSVDDLEKNKDIFAETFKIFEDGVEMNNPMNDGYSLDLALAYVPISNGMKKRVLAGYPSLQVASANGCIYGIEIPVQEKVDKQDSITKVKNCGAENSGNEDSESSEEKVTNETGVQSCNSVMKEVNKTHQIEEYNNKHRNHQNISGQVLTNGKEKAETDLANTNPEAINEPDTKVTSVSIAKKIDTETRNSPGCSRLQLMLNASQLIREEYPLPGNEEFKHFVLTQDKYEPVTDQSPMFSIDCEWCTCIDGSYGLARIAIVGENLKPIYQTFVKPDLEIVDYLTRYSGITKELLKDVTKTLSDVQQDIRKLLPPDAILIGQSLQSDLKALKLIHPYVIDTSVIYNLTGKRSFKTKLKVLVASFCGRSIQDSLSGHDPTEDAVAAMELVLLKLKMGVEFGDVILSRDCEGVGEVRARNRFRDRDDVFVDPDSSVHMKLFTFIQSHNQGATLITTNPSLEKSYRPGILKLSKEIVRNKKKNEPLADPVQIVAAKDFQEAVQSTIQSRLNQSFTLVHTSIEREQEDRKKSLKDLDKAIAEVYHGISLNGMMIVVFGGRTSPLQNGACLHIWTLFSYAEHYMKILYSYGD